jgi:uncharacterized protein YdeI (YjbR/CyaY-like superfamily)
MTGSTASRRGGRVQGNEERASSALAFDDDEAFARWIASQPQDAAGAWVRIAKKGSDGTGIQRRQAIDVALCHGWIDGQGAPCDGSHFLIRFTPRRARSLWSQVNRQRASELMAEGRMTAAGLAQVAAARADGRWERAYPPPSTAAPPEDLQRALSAMPGGLAQFEALSRAERWTCLHGLATVKREDTRARRIAAVVEMLRVRAASR